MAAIDVVAAGIIVVDHVAAPIEQLPTAGQLVLTDDCFLTIGGCASNVAVDLAKMKVAVAVSGLVGSDAFGHFAQEFLESQAVDVSHLAVTQQKATSQTLIVNVRGQDRRFIHHIGANGLYSRAHFPSDLIASARVLYVGGYFLMDQLTPADLAAVFAEARAAGVKTVLDVVTPGPRSDYQSALATILPHTDVFLPNYDEAELMCGLSDPVAQADYFRRAGVGTAVITCGGQGAVLVSAEHRLRAGSFRVPFVDGTGGGDAFDAGFICGLLENASPERCLALGSALGASCVRVSGATAGVFRREEAEAFLAAHPFPIETLSS